MHAVNIAELRLSPSSCASSDAKLCFPVMGFFTVATPRVAVHKHPVSIAYSSIDNDAVKRRENGERTEVPAQIKKRPVNGVDEAHKASGRRVSEGRMLADEEQ
jgi:hypothetical protein